MRKPFSFFILSLSLLTGCHSGLYRAVKVLRQEGTVPPSMKLLTPVSGTSPLGTSVRPQKKRWSEAIELQPEKCFWIKDVGTRALKSVEFTDAQQQSLNVMLGVQNIADVGLKFKRMVGTTGKFHDVKAFSGTGVFDGNQCALKEGGRYRIVTGALSGTFKVTTSTDLSVAPGAAITIPNTPVDVKVENETAKQRKATFVSKEPVFFTATTSLVTVEKSSTKKEPIPPGGMRNLAFPTGFTGHVVMNKFDSGNMTATFIVKPDLSVAGMPPEGFTGTSCNLNAETSLVVGRSCHIWFRNAAIILNVEMDGNVPMFYLDAYRTNLITEGEP